MFVKILICTLVGLFAHEVCPLVITKSSSQPKLGGYVEYEPFAIHRVASTPVNGIVEFDGSYKRQYLPYIQSVDQDGTKTILTPQDLLALEVELQSDRIPSTTIYQLVDLQDFVHTLSNHQLERMLKHEVAAIVNPHKLNQPGFGHFFHAIDNNGLIQTFIYNLSLGEAMDKVAVDGFPNYHSSGNSYHRNPASVNDASSSSFSI